jgi:ribosome modulation factor
MFDKTKLINEGAEAGLDGLPLDACPYPLDSLEYALWVDGWNCAAEGTAEPEKRAEVQDWAA